MAQGAGHKAQGTKMLYVISYTLYEKDCTEYLGSSIKYTHSPKDTEQLITYNFSVSPFLRACPPSASPSGEAGGSPSRPAVPSA
jgi:hypothetical protein